MRGAAPRRDRFEHVVLEDEIVGVRPVIWDVTPVLVAHYVRARAGGWYWAARRLVPMLVELTDIAVHLAAVYIRNEAEGTVATAHIGVPRIVVRQDAVLGHRVRVAIDHSGRLHQAISAGVHPEVFVEAAVLLHDDDHVLDVVDAPACASRDGVKSSIAEERSEKQKAGEQ